jgi:hypothetical protein
MKTLKSILAFLVFALLTISCDSVDGIAEPVKYDELATYEKPVANEESVTNAEPVTYNEENPLDAYMAISGFSQEAIEYNSEGTWEFGFGFVPTVNGTINSLIVEFPYAKTAVRVTLWDVATKTAKTSEVVSVPKANVTVEKSIAPIALIKDKEYFISVNSHDYWFRSKTDHSATVYPIVTGNITITGVATVRHSVEAETIFPTNAVNVGYYGNISFKFQQTE